MNTSEIAEKLADFFDLSKKKRSKKHKKLLKIIAKLEDKKAGLEADLLEAGEQDESSDKYVDWSQELEVVTKLLEKARKHEKKD
jgi:hypothetical protein